MRVSGSGLFPQGIFFLKYEDLVRDPEAVQQMLAEGLGLTFEEVKAIKPDIVYVHCLGFGSEGPYAGRPAYDDLIQGLSAATSLLPKVDGNPRPRFIPTAFADKVSGLHAVYATLAALRQRDSLMSAANAAVDEARAAPARAAARAHANVSRWLRWAVRAAAIERSTSEGTSGLKMVTHSDGSIRSTYS